MSRFEFLKAHNREWHGYATEGEASVAAQLPSGALVAFRKLTEAIAFEFAQGRVEVGAQDTLDTLEKKFESNGLLPRDKIRLMRKLRQKGNAAAHRSPVDLAMAVENLDAAVEFAQWYCSTYGKASGQTPAYKAPEQYTDRTNPRGVAVRAELRPAYATSYPNRDFNAPPMLSPGYSGLAGLSSGGLIALVVGFVPSWIVSGIFGWVAGGGVPQNHELSGVQTGWTWFWVLWVGFAVLGMFIGGIEHANGGWIENPHRDTAAARRFDLSISLPCLAIAAAAVLFSVHYGMGVESSVQARIQKATDQQRDFTYHLNRAISNSSAGIYTAAENEFAAAYRIAAGNQAQQQQVLATRRNWYALIQVPAQGSSVPYSVRGNVFITLGFLTTKDYTFKPTETGRVLAPDPNWIAVSSDGTTYTPATIGAIINNRGVVLGPYASQNEASLRLSFQSTDGRPKNIFITTR